MKWMKAPIRGAVKMGSKVFIVPVVLAAVAVSGTVASFTAVARDGCRRVPTRHR
jgi:hypothetical protein